MTPAEQKLYDILDKHCGCGDNSCAFKSPKGMATNGGCRCLDGWQRPAPPLLVSALANWFREKVTELAARTCAFCLGGLRCGCRKCLVVHAVEGGQLGRTIATTGPCQHCDGGGKP